MSTSLSCSFYRALIESLHSLLSFLAPCLLLQPPPHPHLPPPSPYPPTRSPLLPSLAVLGIGSCNSSPLCPLCPSGIKGTLSLRVLPELAPARGVCIMVLTLLLAALCCRRWLLCAPVCCFVQPCATVCCFMLPCTAVFSCVLFGACYCALLCGGSEHYFARLLSLPSCRVLCDVSCVPVLVCATMCRCVALSAMGMQFTRTAVLRLPCSGDGGRASPFVQLAGIALRSLTLCSLPTKQVSEKNQGNSYS